MNEFEKEVNDYITYNILPQTFMYSQSNLENISEQWFKDNPRPF